MSHLRQTLTLSCPDRPGLVAGVARLLADNGGNIMESQQFNDQESDRFFMRVVFELADNSEALRSAFSTYAAENSMEWEIRSSDSVRKVLLMVSKFDHCLGDLLYRHRIGEIPMEIVGIICNHPREALKISLIDEIPFHYLPITKDTKPQQEAQIKEIVNATGAELVVLARYSFLPGFKGAKPYHQAHARGVKMIGATAHYVTEDLDEGPIIHQDVEEISHADAPDDLVRKGRDIERRVLAQAVHWHLQGRVFVNGHRTVVFKD